MVRQVARAIGRRVARAPARNSGGSDIVLNFLGSLPPVITFTRASSGTAYNSSGVNTSYATNVARFDYNPSTLAAMGLLVEGSRTNLLLWNRDFTNAAWVKVNTSAAKTATGIDGVINSASTITATAGLGAVLQTVVSGSAARATSCYVKRRTGSGTIEMTQDGITWTVVTVTSSWTRVGLTSATVTNPVVGFRITTSGDAIDVDYAQLESATFASSAIETTTAAVTRASEVASITDLATVGLSDSIIAGGITIVFEYELMGLLAQQQTLINIGLNTNNYIALRANTTGTLTATVVASGTPTVNSSTSNALSVGSIGKAALSISSAGASWCLNGGTVMTDASVTLPTGLTTLKIASNQSSAEPLFGWVRGVAIYQGILNTQALTA